MGEDDEWVRFDWEAQLKRSSPAFAAVAGDERPGWLREHGSGGDPPEMRDVVVRARPEPDWLEVGTWFPGVHGKHVSEDRDAELTWMDLADRIGAFGAELLSGEAVWNREAMTRRLEACQAAARQAWEPASLTIDGRVEPARRTMSGRYELIVARVVDAPTVFVARPITHTPFPSLAWRTDWSSLRLDH